MNQEESRRKLLACQLNNGTIQRDEFLAITLHTMETSANIYFTNFSHLSNGIAAVYGAVIGSLVATSSYLLQGNFSNLNFIMIAGFSVFIIIIFTTFSNFYSNREKDTATKFRQDEWSFFVDTIQNYETKMNRRGEKK